MLAPGVVLGRFRIVAPLGRGGMGEVWRAHDPRLGRDVAIKVLPEWLESPESVARFEREARALAALSHPNVAQIYEVGEAAPVRANVAPAPAATMVHFLVMELVDGESLAARLKRGPLPLAEALRVCRDVARALAAAHDAGVIHRDLKPGNIMLTADGPPKVLDFGLALLHRRDGRKAGADVTAELIEMGVVGTAAYMAPEQVRGEECGEGCDVWALGCCCGEILGGRPVFSGTTLPEIVARVLSGAPDLTRLPRSTPLAVRSLILACLAQDRAARPSMEKLVVRLERAVERLALPTLRRVVLPWLAVTVAGLALAAALAALVLRLSAPAAPRTGTAPPLEVLVEPVRAGATAPGAGELARLVTTALTSGLGERKGVEVIGRGRGDVQVRAALSDEGGALRLNVTALEVASAAVLAVHDRRVDPGGESAAVAVALRTIGDAIELEAVRREMDAEDPLHGFLVARTRSLAAARAFQLALAAYTHTRWREATQGLDDATRADPSFWPAYLYLALVAKSTGRFDDWQAPLERGRSLLVQPEPAESAVLDLVTAVLAEDQERALQAIEAARKVFPGSAELTYSAARAYRRQDRPEKAIPLLEKLLAAGWQPDWSPTREELAYNEVLAGRCDDALRTAAEAENRFPKRYPPPLYQAFALQMLGRGGEAREALARALRKRLDFSPTDPLVVYQTAQWWAGLLRWPEEQRRLWLLYLDAAEAALRARPGEPELLQARGEALAGLGRHAEALAVLEPLVTRTPAEPYLFLAINRARAGLGDRAGAAAALERAGELWRRGEVPALGTLAYNIACGWLLAGDPERGWEWLLRARDQYGYDRLDLALDPELDPLRTAGRLTKLHS
jgi:hypothetical protein